MYAIVEIAGQQIKVEKDQKVYVNRLEAEAGSKVDFDKVLLIEDDGKVQVGTPVLKNIIVSASVLSHVKGDKIKVFRKKRRKGFQVLNGHRQALTELLIEHIGEGSIKMKATSKKEFEKKADLAVKPAEAVAEKKPAKQKKMPISKTTEAIKESSKSETAKKTGKAKAATSTGKTSKPATKAVTKKEIKSVTKKKSGTKKEDKKVTKSAPKAKKKK